MANEDTYIQVNSSDAYLEFSGDSSGQVQGWYAIGESGEENTIYNNAAVRFSNIEVLQGVTVNFAQLRLYATEQGDNNSMRMNAYGIKETNTSAFTSNPFSRTKTTSVTSHTAGLPGVNAFIGITVTSQVNEIIGQAGWESGNAMGFIITDNTSDNFSYIGDTGLHAQLVIRVSAEPNFTPTAGTISAPTFPTEQNYGIRVSQPNIDVGTASESQLFFTTRKSSMKVASEAEATTSTGIYNIAHSLGYVPAVMGFIKGGNNRYKLNKYTGTPSGYIGATGTSIVIYSAQGTGVYYYSFVDPLT